MLVNGTSINCPVVYSTPRCVWPSNSEILYFELWATNNYCFVRKEAKISTPNYYASFQKISGVLFHYQQHAAHVTKKQKEALADLLFYAACRPRASERSDVTSVTNVRTSQLYSFGELSSSRIAASTMHPHPAH